MSTWVSRLLYWVGGHVQRWHTGFQSLVPKGQFGHCMAPTQPCAAGPRQSRVPPAPPVETAAVPGGVQKEPPEWQQWGQSRLCVLPKA